MVAPEARYSVAERAEQIAAHLVSAWMQGTAEKYDVDGRQGAVDYIVTGSSGRTAALEVTLIARKRDMEWDGLARRDDRRWQAQDVWIYRPESTACNYKSARAAAIALAKLCEDNDVDSPQELAPRTRPEALRLWQLQNDLSGTLPRVHGKGMPPGIRTLPPVRCEWVDPDGPDLVDHLEQWRQLPHIAEHIRKLGDQHVATERHLFLIPTCDLLPSRLFTDDFDAPERFPEGFEGLDGLWLWSDYWHRNLLWTQGRWQWLDFPVSSRP